MDEEKGKVIIDWLHLVVQMQDYDILKDCWDVFYGGRITLDDIDAFFDRLQEVEDEEK